MYGSYSFQQIDKVGLKDNFHAFIVDSHHFTLKGPCHCCKFNCFFFCVFSYLEEAWLQPTSLAEFQMFSLVTTTDIHNQLQIDKYNNVVIILLLFMENKKQPVRSYLWPVFPKDHQFWTRSPSAPAAPLMGHLITMRWLFLFFDGVHLIMM